MTPTTGNKRRAYVVDASTYTWLAGEQNNSVNLNGNLIDISDKSTDWQKWIAGVKGGTISITVFTDNESAAEQKKFLNALNGVCARSRQDDFTGAVRAEQKRKERL